ncbi:hypothetical protein GGTG_11056 [Gaeumannomyces tritici R3-111a-1]|uniref:Uncharacterized protein n=1 Tax=Gaeumannomyces tritici (strain R3-111a-1) TaxID=644352 RepID=J3PC33_GAET3|nr:hypothetical protein GGTG_11056 [Gaeumannomyces tritici R3-111a-1]EJT71803.1 hypothetical protein GGTG_11056 [Gaeumannomyces tritici R3-111a-1]
MTSPQSGKGPFIRKPAMLGSKATARCNSNRPGVGTIKRRAGDCVFRISTSVARDNGTPPLVLEERPRIDGNMHRRPWRGSKRQGLFWCRLSVDETSTALTRGRGQQGVQIVSGPPLLETKKKKEEGDVVWPDGYGRFQICRAGHHRGQRIGLTGTGVGCNHGSRHEETCTRERGPPGSGCCSLWPGSEKQAPCPVDERWVRLKAGYGLRPMTLRLHLRSTCAHDCNTDGKTCMRISCRLTGAVRMDRNGTSASISRPPQL